MTIKITGDAKAILTGLEKATGVEKMFAEGEEFHAGLLVRKGSVAAVVRGMPIILDVADDSVSFTGAMAVCEDIGAVFGELKGSLGGEIDKLTSEMSASGIKTEKRISRIP